MNALIDMLYKCRFLSDRQVLLALRTVYMLRRWFR